METTRCTVSNVSLNDLLERANQKLSHLKGTDQKQNQIKSTISEKIDRGYSVRQSIY